jgi:hypothetical protein
MMARFYAYLDKVFASRVLFLPFLRVRVPHNLHAATSSVDTHGGPRAVAGTLRRCRTIGLRRAAWIPPSSPDSRHFTPLGKCPPSRRFPPVRRNRASSGGFPPT